MDNSVATEFRRGWLAILACAVGVGVGLTGLPFYTFGLFVNPLEESFGWSRSDVMSGMLIINACTVVTSPVLGMIMDRFGVRVIAIPALIGLAAGFYGLSMVGPSLSGFYLAWCVIAILGSGTTPLTWTRAISQRFDKARGLALGMALLGTGIASSFGPLLVQKAINAGGWQAGYQSMAIFTLAIALPLAILGIGRNQKKPGTAGSAPALPLTGLNLREAIRTKSFWLIIAGIFLIIIAQASATVHFIPLLRGRGISAQTAAGIISALGFSVIIGRLVVGYLLDRFHAPHVARVVLVLPALSLAILLFRTDLPSAWIAAILLGLAAGAEVALLAYLVSRFFGLRRYGLIYGVTLSAFSMGAAVGPKLTGVVFDRTGNYDAALIGGIVIFIIGAALIGSLGRYPEFDREEQTSEV